MNLSEIEQIAKSCVDDPMGCGNPILEKIGNNELYYKFLHDVVKYYKPEVVVECGVSTAVSTIHMAMGNLTTEVIGIDFDPNEQAYSFAKQHANLTLVVSNSMDAGTFERVKALCGDKRIGLLFLDSEHDGTTPNKEYQTYKPLFAEECLVCCDDVFIGDSMKKFWSDFPGEKMESLVLHGAVGFGVSIIRR